MTQKLATEMRYIKLYSLIRERKRNSRKREVARGGRKGERGREKERRRGWHGLSGRESSQNNKIDNKYD